MADIVLYAKKSCAQCKKAISLLNKKGISYQLKDIVHEPPPRSLLEKVIKAENIYASLNQRSIVFQNMVVLLAKNCPRWFIRTGPTSRVIP